VSLVSQGKRQANWWASARIHSAAYKSNHDSNRNPNPYK